jgi:DNA-binding PadR family transcriptional regulator
MDEAGLNGPATGRALIDRAIVGALRGQNLSGFEIWRWLGSEVDGPGRLIETNLYPTLYRLEAEGLLESDWHEGERIRRRYRLTSRALQLAEARGWPALAYQRGQSLSGAADRVAHRSTSPAPDSGAWFVPPRADAPTTAPTDRHADRDDERRLPTAGELSLTATQPDRPGTMALATYADELVACLDLPRPQLNRVRQEIADHLHDSARALEQGGYDAETAATEAGIRMGSPRDLAATIDTAQHTASRRNRGIRRGALTIAAEMALWLTLSAVVIILAPTVADAVVGLGSLAGLHLVVLRPGPWVTGQIGIMLCVGAFSAGRISLGHLARISRHRDASLRRPWAIGGAAALLAAGLLLPGYQDALTVATLLAVPFAFVAGTLRPQQLYERSYSVRGVATAVLVVTAVTLLPCGRLFAYDPSATPATPLAPGGVSVQLTWIQLPDGTFAYEVPQSTGTGIVTVELWPAATEGPFILVDRSATEPTIGVSPGTPNADTTKLPAGAGAVDFSKLPPYSQWWVVAVAKAPNGQRTALGVAIQTGVSPTWGNGLSWLISKL